MIVTQGLKQAAGIQYTRVDQSISAIGGQASIVGVIAGYFRRGSLTPFPVSTNDYRARLGHDPDNKFYVAVQDALKLFPIVWIQRLVQGDVYPEPSDCTPSEPVEFTAAWSQLVSHKRLTFRINGSPPSIFTGLAEVGDDDADINFEDYFSRFAAVNRVGDDYPIISTTGSNQCAFRVGFDNESGQAIISARDDSYNPLSTTLELIATDHPDDFATHYFGGSVTLHACGISEPA